MPVRSPGRKRSPTSGEVPLDGADPAVVASVACHHYPRSYRMALALTGDTAVARAAAGRVLRGTAVAGRRWRSADEAARWFDRYTVIATREVARLHRRPGGSRDPLTAGTADPGYAAFIAALRALPQQHREAFLLHRGQAMDLHRLSTAMDCSSAAASNHLVAATDSLRPSAGGRMAEFTDALAAALARLVPPAADLTAEVKAELDRQRRRHAAVAVVRWTLAAVTAGAAGWFGWQVWRMLVL